MIPDNIVHYLQQNAVPFARHWHPRAVAAQRLAQSLHVSGRRVAKAVIVLAGDRPYIAVVPAHRRAHLGAISRALGDSNVHLAPESRFPTLFPDCEVGAEPPFGGLYGIPVLLDAGFDPDGHLIVRAGSHEETVELSFVDLVRLEQPLIASLSEDQGAAETHVNGIHPPSGR